MKEPKTIDVLLLILLGAIWGSAFFNIKIATYTYDPVTLVFLRVFFALVALGLYCLYKKIKILAFSNNWKIYAIVGLTNITIPFLLIAYGTNVVDSYLSAILMSTTPLSGTLLAHFFIKNEKLNIFKSTGVLIGFVGIVFLFFDKLVISESNLFYALVILCGSTFYVVGGILTLRFLKNDNFMVINFSCTLLYLSRTLGKLKSLCRIYYCINLFRNFSNWYCLVIKIPYFDKSRNGFSNTSCLFNTNIWSYIWIFNYG